MGIQGRGPQTGYNPGDITITGGSITGTTVSEVVVYNNVDTTINLTVADLNKIWVIDNANNVVVNLPSVSPGEIGYWTESQKLGAGNLTIIRADADMILDGTSIANIVAAQTYAFIRLILATETLWRMQASLGSWSTS
ncbi:hypothetical protein KAX02_03060 [candidate division WOR-3 bacterium]|nr:hypothetical protein [candidate division WOR-3 bacterium]